MSVPGSTKGVEMEEDEDMMFVVEPNDDSSMRPGFVL